MRYSDGASYDACGARRMPADHGCCGNRAELSESAHTHDRAVRPRRRLRFRRPARGAEAERANGSAGRRRQSHGRGVARRNRNRATRSARRLHASARRHRIHDQHCVLQERKIRRRARFRADHGRRRYAVHTGREPEPAVQRDSQGLHCSRTCSTRKVQHRIIGGGQRHAFFGRALSAARRNRHDPCAVQGRRCGARRCRRRAHPIDHDDASGRAAARQIRQAENNRRSFREAQPLAARRAHVRGKRCERRPREQLVRRADRWRHTAADRQALARGAFARDCGAGCSGAADGRSASAGAGYARAVSQEHRSGSGALETSDEGKRNPAGIKSTPLLRYARAQRRAYAPSGATFNPALLRLTPMY
jgi:hypothetical protein